MAKLHAENFADQVIGTQRELGRLKVSQIAQALTDYPLVRLMLKKERRMYLSGRGISIKLFDRLSSSAKMVGVMDEQIASFGDHLRDMTTDWVHASADYSMEYRTDVLMNRGEAKISDIIKIKRVAALLNLVELLDDKGWSAPTSSTDNLNPRGIPYWIVTNSERGFNGSAHANIGGATVGGIDTDIVTNFKNWTDTYKDVTYSDAIRSMRLAFMRIKFRSPENIAEYRGNDKFRIWVNDETKLNFDDILTGQNDNLKADVATFDGQSVFKRIPIGHVPQLDSDTTNPIFMLNHGTFFFAVLTGDFFRQTHEKAPHQPNVTTHSIWLTFNGVCVDRRRNAILYVI